MRLSSRIYLAIAALKYSEKTLNRPFVFKGIAYDDFMNKEIRVVRYKIIKQYPERIKSYLLCSAHPPT